MAAVAPRAKSTESKTSDMPAVPLTWKQVRAWRLQRHHLDRRTPRASMLDVVAEICGLHAQLMWSAELGARLRENWGACLKPAAFLGHLCSAPSVGQNVRFTRPQS